MLSFRRAVGWGVEGRLACRGKYDVEGELFYRCRFWSIVYCVFRVSRGRIGAKRWVSGLCVIC